MSIYGYSERGINNSMAYFLDANPQCVHGFITKLGIPLEKKENYDYTILVEQSFSDFGDSDLLIILKKNNKKIVIFIECKIKTCQGTFQIQSEFNKILKAIKERKKIKGISSNLFVQLYYKYLLIKPNGERNRDSTINEIFMKSNNNPRVLGNNKIVKKAFGIIEKANDYYFVAIVPTGKNKINAKIFQKKIDELCLMPSENCYLCYWEDIKDYFTDINAAKVLETFGYNKGQIY
jgi:hypothetical protein